MLWHLSIQERRNGAGTERALRISLIVDTMKDMTVLQALSFVGAVVACGFVLLFFRFLSVRSRSPRGRLMVLFALEIMGSAQPAAAMPPKPQNPEQSVNLLILIVIKNLYYNINLSTTVANILDKYKY